MRVRINDPKLREELIEALHTVDCVSGVAPDGSCEVLHPFAIDAEEARVELAFFVRAWRCRHPHVTIELVA